MINTLIFVTNFFFFRLDHYKRPPSRDSSVDRYRTNRLLGSRQPSVDKQSQDGDRLEFNYEFIFKELKILFLNLNREIACLLILF